MDNRNKLIVFILVIIIVIPLVYFEISSYFHDLEEQTFYNTIKEISDKENKSDIEYNEYSNKDSHTDDEVIDIHTKSIDVLNTEIDMLKDLNEKLTNETYKEYINIEINRINSEIRYDELLINGAKIDNQYNNGEITLSKGNEQINFIKSELSSYGNKTTDYKIDADSFLTNHDDIKNRFELLSIDEDFLYAQLE